MSIHSTSEVLTGISEDTARIYEALGGGLRNSSELYTHASRVVHGRTIPLAHIFYSVKEDGFSCFDNVGIDHAECVICCMGEQACPKTCPVRCRSEPFARPAEVCFMTVLESVATAWTGNTPPVPLNDVQFCHCNPSLLTNFPKELTSRIHAQNWAQIDSVDSLLTVLSYLPWHDTTRGRYRNGRKVRSRTPPLKSRIVRWAKKDLEATKREIMRAIHASNNIILKMLFAVPYARITYEQIWRATAGLVQGFLQEMHLFDLDESLLFTPDMKGFIDHVGDMFYREDNYECYIRTYTFKTSLGVILEPWLKEFETYWTLSDQASVANRTSGVILAEGRILPHLPPVLREQKLTEAWKDLVEREPNPDIDRIKTAQRLMGKYVATHEHKWQTVEGMEDSTSRIDFDYEVKGRSSDIITSEDGGKLEGFSRYVLWGKQGLKVPVRCWKTGKITSYYGFLEGDEKLFVFRLVLQQVVNAMPQMEKFHYELRIGQKVLCEFPFASRLLGIDEPGKLRFLLAGSCAIHFLHSPFATLIKANLALDPMHNRGLTGEDHSFGARNAVGMFGNRHVLYTPDGDRRARATIGFYDFSKATDELDRQLGGALYSLMLEGCGVGTWMKKVLVLSMMYPLVVHLGAQTGINRVGTMMGCTYAKALLHGLQIVVHALALEQTPGQRIEQTSYSMYDPGTISSEIEDSRRNLLRRARDRQNAGL